MNKETLKFIVKEIKKENPLTIRYEPTLEEIEYLQSKNISVYYNPKYIARLICDGYTQYDFFTYIQE